MTFWDWEWVWSNLDLIGEKLVEHLWLTFLAVTIGLAISVPLAILASRRRRLLPPITWLAGILYTIPSLALFALLTPFTGLTTLTAEIGLVSYTLLILIRNIVSGLAAVPGDVKESARGMGLTDRQILWRVELPIAIPVVVAGLRIATVTTIGLVTVTVFVGKGGLGYLILNGFRRLLPDINVVVGLGLSLLLAMLLDGALLAGQRLLTPWARATHARHTA